MRPDNLIYLFSNIFSIKGIGEKTIEYLNLENNQIIDVIFKSPKDIITRNVFKNISEINDGEFCTTYVEIDSISRMQNNSKHTIIRAHDETGFLNIIFFNLPIGYINKQYKKGDKKYISAKFNKYGNTLQVVHPSYVKNNKESIIPFEPVYPIPTKINSTTYRFMVEQICQNLPQFDEWIPKTTIEKFGFKPWLQSIQNLHNITSIEDFKSAKKRLAYDEILAHTIANKIVLKRKSKNGHSTKKSEKIYDFINSLEFELTDGQKQICENTFEQQQSDNNMFKLVQGDVGCGKTIIGFISMVNCFFNQEQSVMLVPTGLLSSQHYANFVKITEKLSIRTALLTSNTKNKEKIINDYKNGDIDVLIGTHSLFKNNINFDNTKLFVIDELHKFGVKDKLELINSNKNSNILTFSATPIPRTLLLSMHDQLLIENLKEKPKNKNQIKTTIMSVDKTPDIINKIKNKKTFWVCPKLTQKEDNSYMSVEERYQILSKIIDPNKIGVVHGKLKEEERNGIFEKFKNNEITILISTTVIEVGIDIPDATVIIIENAENFGLAQLHQIRGRIGRGQQEGFAILLYNPKNMTPISKKRLEIIKTTNDGFEISQHDLEMRGGGDILGTNQSGFSNYLIANDYDFINMKKNAQNDAETILKNSNINNEFLTLLYLFKIDKVLNNLNSI